MLRIHPTLLPLAAVAALSACSFSVDTDTEVEGSGAQTTETREFSDFSGIRLESDARVEVSIGAGRSASVTGEENVVPLI